MSHPKARQFTRKGLTLTIESPSSLEPLSILNTDLHSLWLKYSFLKYPNNWRKKVKVIYHWGFPNQWCNKVTLKTTINRLLPPLHTQNFQTCFHASLFNMKSPGSQGIVENYLKWKAEIYSKANKSIKKVNEKKSRLQTEKESTSPKILYSLSAK